MNIKDYHNQLTQEVRQLKGATALLEWLREGVHTPTNRRWFLQPSTLLAVSKHHGKEALLLAQDYLDEPMLAMDDYTLLSKEERKVLGPKMAQKTKLESISSLHLWAYIGWMTNNMHFKTSWKLPNMTWAHEESSNEIPWGGEAILCGWQMPTHRTGRAT